MPQTKPSFLLIVSLWQIWQHSEVFVYSDEMNNEPQTFYLMWDEGEIHQEKNPTGIMISWVHKTLKLNEDLQAMKGLKFLLQEQRSI